MYLLMWIVPGYNFQCVGSRRFILLLRCYVVCSSELTVLSRISCAVKVCTCSLNCFFVLPPFMLNKRIYIVIRPTNTYNHAIRHGARTISNLITRFVYVKIKHIFIFTLDCRRRSHTLSNSLLSTVSNALCTHLHCALSSDHIFLLIDEITKTSDLIVQQDYVIYNLLLIGVTRNLSQHLTLALYQAPIEYCP